MRTTIGIFIFIAPDWIAFFLRQTHAGKADEYVRKYVSLTFLKAAGHYVSAIFVRNAKAFC